MQRNKGKSGEGNSPVNRFQKEIESSLSPKFTEMKTSTNSRTSRFGRPQKQTEQENTVPSDISKFVSKHSPKRLKIKENTQEADMQQKERTQSIAKDESPSKSSSENKENASENEERKVLQIESKEIVEPEKFECEEIEEPEKLVSKEIEEPTLAVTEIITKESEEVNNQTTTEVIEESDLKLDNFKDNNNDQAVDEGISEGEKEKQDLSDTDSALGSATSSDPSSDDFVAGQLLWGSLSRGSSWYPCMVYPDEEGNVVGIHKNKAKVVHVKYFSLGGFASLNCKNVFEYKTIEDFWLQIKELNIKKSRVKPFTKACYKNMEEAKFIQKFPINERITAFERLMELQLKQKEKGKLKDNDTSSNGNRKSVDSVLDSPSSSSSNKDNPKDPFETFLEVVAPFTPMTVKNVRKRTSTPKVVQEAVLDEEKDNSRRRSVREKKKRKFEDFEEDVKSETSETKQADSIIKPQVKRQKLQKEETLEERFVVDSKYLRNIFHSVNKKKVCSACLEADTDPTFKCSGKENIKCAEWIHEKCSGHSETKREEIRHQTGDSDEIIQTSTLKTIVTCKSCFDLVKNCFVCKHPVDAEESRQCVNMECRLAFHHRCLTHFPESKNSKNANQCPQHMCHTCFSKDIHCSGRIMKCVKCPAAYHTQFGCIPAGSKILSQSQLICPRHPDEKELKKSAKEKSLKPLNIDWCAICNKSGDLVCCDWCPSSFHYQCVGYKESDDKFICQECQEGRLPLNNTIVWARVGTYRWWPGLVMINSVVPESVLKTQRFDREFCVRFFGSYDYSWFTCERVFSYDGTNLSVKGGKTTLELAFNTALEEAHQLFEILNNDHSLSVEAKPKPYTKLLSNRPIPPVKFKKIGERSQEQCSCLATDPNPCGRESNCINMHLDVECNKATCPAGDQCQNQKLSRRQYAELKIVPTATRGFGAVCKTDIPLDTFVIEYVGDLINGTEYTKRITAKIENKEKDFYFLSVEADLYVDAEPSGNLARFINHSCEPNCTTRKIIVDGNTRIGIYSNQFIKAGTELTFDYQMEFIDKKKTACFCGSKNCSGLIGEKIKEPARKLVVKKKVRRRATANPIKPRKARSVEDTNDPFETLLQKVNKSKLVTKKEDEDKTLNSAIEDEKTKLIGSELESEAVENAANNNNEEAPPANFVETMDVES